MKTVMYTKAVAVAATVGLTIALTSGAATVPVSDEESRVEAEATRILEEGGFDTSPESFDSSEVLIAEADGSFTIRLEKSGASGYSVVCGGESGDNAVRDPHYSSGAGGAIYKTEIWCTGTGLATVDVRTQGLLTFAPSSSPSNTNVTFSTRATSDLTQTIVVNGIGKIFLLRSKDRTAGAEPGFGERPRHGTSS